jgi:hypothetical protein
VSSYLTIYPLSLTIQKKNINKLSHFIDFRLAAIHPPVKTGGFLAAIIVSRLTEKNKQLLTFVQTGVY